MFFKLPAKTFLLYFALLGFFLFSSSVFAKGATLEDYWNGNANFKYINKFSFPTSGGNAWKSLNFGMDIKVVGNTWYLFTREYGFASKPSYCSRDFARLVVRTSTDRGRTWSKKQVVLEPKEGTPYECAAVDSYAFYDKDLSKWHLLYQCLDRNGSFNLCYAYKNGASPVGKFTPANKDNNKTPVIKNGEVWSKFLNRNNLSLNVGDEGTPEILYKKNGFFYVTLHGFDGKNGYRGLFKTSDFLTWEPAIPKFLYSKEDCKFSVNWKDGGCIGGGQATTLKEGSNYYMLIESSDKNLLCTPGQNWVYGLLRKKDLLNSSLNWEYLSDGGVVLSAYNQDANASCGVQYARLFKDKDNITYLLVARTFKGNRTSTDTDYKTGIYLYELIKNYPEAVYDLQDNPNDLVLLSKSVSRDNLVVGLSKGLTWSTSTFDNKKNILRFKDTSAVPYIEFPNNPVFNLRNPASLDLRIGVDLRGVPKEGSSFIVGKPESYYLELYKDWGLCGWFWSPSKKAESVCINYSPFKKVLDPSPHTIQLTLNNGVASLYIDQDLKAQKKLSFTSLNKGKVFRLGSAKKYEKNGYFKPFTGDVYWLSFGRNSYSENPIDNLGYKETFSDGSGFGGNPPIGTEPPPIGTNPPPGGGPGELVPQDPGAIEYNADINFDGKYNTFEDAIALLKYLFLKKDYFCNTDANCTSSNKKCFASACVPDNFSDTKLPHDVNRDGKINILDLLVLVKVIN